MAKSRKLEELLTALDQIKGEPNSPEGISTLTRILASRNSLAIARAAKLAGEKRLNEMIPPLVAAFQPLMLKPSETDPGCLAKQEIAQALYRLESSDTEVFRQGIHHIQMEPVWGGQEDRAAKLRGICALGLVRANDANVMVELADLLADPESEARIAATRAIAYSGDIAGVPLLRLRLRIGDIPPVVQECLIALLQLAPNPSLPLARELLYSQARSGGVIATAEAVALALGESRLPEAWPLLRDWWQQVGQAELRRSGLLAMALLRNDQVMDFLMEVIATGELVDAIDAIAALRIYQSDRGLWGKVCQAVTQRADERLLREI
jgi:HEAT repeat protein